MYGSIVEAFNGLVDGKARGNEGLALGIPFRITRLSAKESRLENGLEYCFVEVTFADGVQYGLDAYGYEAAALRRATLAVAGINGARESLMIAPMAH